MSFSLPVYIKRLFKFSQLDFEVSIWEMLTLMYNPRRVYKQIFYHVRLIPFCTKYWHCRDVTTSISTLTYRNNRSLCTRWSLLRSAAFLLPMCRSISMGARVRPRLPLHSQTDGLHGGHRFCISRIIYSDIGMVPSETLLERTTDGRGFIGCDFRCWWGRIGVWILFWCAL
jgi:hypothetical protein